MKILELQNQTTVKSLNPELKKLNGLGCPTCSSPLIDNIPQYEFHIHIKSVHCTNCDYIGKRDGFKLLNLQEIKDLSLIAVKH